MCKQWSPDWIYHVLYICISWTPFSTGVQLGLEKHLFLTFHSQGKINTQLYQFMFLASGAEENREHEWSLRADTECGGWCFITLSVPVPARSCCSYFPIATIWLNRYIVHWNNIFSLLFLNWFCIVNLNKRYHGTVQSNKAAVLWIVVCVVSGADTHQVGRLQLVKTCPPGPDPPASSSFGRAAAQVISLQTMLCTFLHWPKCFLCCSHHHCV